MTGDENRARLQRALRNKGARAQPAPQRSGFAPVESGGWSVPNAFGFRNDGRFDPVMLGDNLSGAVREGARFWNEDLAPVRQAVGQGFQRVGDAFSQGASATLDAYARSPFASERDRAEMRLRDQYMPLIRDANQRTENAMNTLDARERATVGRLDVLAGRARDMRGALVPEDDFRDDPWTIPPEMMTDEELLAELERGSYR